MQTITEGPWSGWIGDWVPEPTSQIAGHVTAATGRPFVVVLYGIPNRDSGNYSAGGFPDRATYLSWVTKARNGSGTAPVWWVLEPDALGLSNDFDATTRAERQETLRQAVVILKGDPNAKVYVDASMWVPPADMAALLDPAGISVADGFSCNVSNFETTAAATSWANQVVGALASAGTPGKKYVVDTSRNGNGVLPDNYPGADIWVSTDQKWANPPGRGAGFTPRNPSDQPHCDAYLWLKNVGESDGDFPTAAQQPIFSTDAPIAGTFWDEWFDDFAYHTTLLT